MKLFITIVLLLAFSYQVRAEAAECPIVDTMDMIELESLMSGKPLSDQKKLTMINKGIAEMKRYLKTKKLSDRKMTSEEVEVCKEKLVELNDAKKQLSSNSNNNQSNGSSKNSDDICKELLYVGQAVGYKLEDPCVIGCFKQATIIGLGKSRATIKFVDSGNIREVYCGDVYINDPNK